MRSRSVFLPLLIVYLAVRIFWYGWGLSPSISDSPFVESVFKLLVWVVPCIVTTMILARASLHEAWRQLGLDAAVGRGWRFGLLATVPMAVAVIVAGPRMPDLDGIIGTALLGPFAEEVLFRGFLFTALYRDAGWRLPWAIAVSALVFGLAHQRDLDVHVVSPFVAAVTGHPTALWRFGRGLDGVVTGIGLVAFGGSLFAWVFYRWGSLWPVIGLHACINLWWEVSRGDRPPVFELDLAGAAQITSMALAVVLTLRLAGAPLTSVLPARPVSAASDPP